MKEFLKKKNIEFSVNRYLITALSYMTYGLFASLIIGSILNQIGLKLGIPFLSETIWPVAKAMTGPSIAVAVSYGLEAPPLVIFSSIITGAIGGSLGGPVGAFVASVIGTEFGKLISKETRIDILITPSVTIIVGSLVGFFIGPYIDMFMKGFGEIIIYLTEIHTLPMSILISVIMGMALTLPISSAAIGIMLSMSGLAAGAATAGCAAQMVGFAVMSYKENKVSGLLSQGLGTSMLQMPNIIKNWRVWIPVILTSAITGPIATMVFKLENTAIGSGMGTSGFVGQFGTVEAMEKLGYSPSHIMLSILMVHFILPIALTLVFSNMLRKMNWIKEGDLKLEL